MGILDRRPVDFMEHNAFLHFVLGVESARRKLDALVARHGRPRAPGAAGASGEDDGAMLYFVLGLSSFGARIAEQVQAMRAPSSEAPAGAKRSGLRDLLR